LELQVGRAEASLASAQSQLDRLLAPPRAEDIAAREADVAAARSQVSSAVANRNQLTGEASEAELASAQVQLADAEQQYRSALRTWDHTDKKDRRWDQANYDLWAAQLALDAAQTELDQLLAGPNADQAREAQANVASAVAQRDAAQAQLDLLLAGPTEEQIAAQEAAVAQARVALARAQLQLDRATLSAPMAGTITSLDVEVGERVAAGQQIGTLSDLTALEIELNLDETDAARVAVGQPAQVTLDVFPGMQMTGGLVYVAQKADTSSGLVLYPVTVRLEQIGLSAGSDQTLVIRAGMTADVQVTTASQENVLIMPLRAVQMDGAQAYAERLIGGQLEDGVERVNVELGMTTETDAEITSGLADGDVVVVIASAVPDSGTQMPGPMGGMFRRD
jgi:HlyD family secretion protein